MTETGSCSDAGLCLLTSYDSFLFGLMHIEAQSGKLQTCLRAFACHPCNQAAAPWLLRQTWRESYRKIGSTSAPSEPVTLRLL